MKPRQKCCSHCPGKLTASFDLGEHVCPLPKYISGNLKLTSLKNAVPGEEERSERLSKKAPESIPERSDSCNDRFAIAKKFHADNLQHQPLPDKVDDAIFTNTKFPKPMENLCSRCKTIERCRKIIPRLKRDHQSQNRKFGPALGCKKPETYMDLAICWETPIDPEYEPRRAHHIDGSDGGPAPAVFSLVQHSLTSSDKIVQQCQGCNRQLEKNDDQPKNGNQEEEDEGKNCDLCENFDSIRISAEDNRKNNYIKSNLGFRQRPKHANQLRHCTACDAMGKGTGNNCNKAQDSRLIQSASCFAKNKNCRRNGLPTKFQIPRPKTPFARRSFCIDTLAPPFSIIQGCRDADYPEHWRLTSVYQQSYRNPKKQKGTILHY
ncbi:uncharacterized protein LOC117173719 [Belonocnema kinseyi]|uniref:uncharacterized protein LOC117173719 n=1 Tax=Belonocnema kinseyi TaxID=2817044 RepID=UPI00143D0FC7|nr:uncharacterized protein LOC117173719 [Belonocnema kinseyi]